VIEHDIMDDADAVFIQQPAGIFQRVLVAVFGRERSFLRELAKIEEIVGVVSDRISAGGPLVGRRQPDISDAHRCKAFCLFCYLIPETASILRVPVEKLQQRATGHRILVIDGIRAPLTGGQQKRSRDMARVKKR